MADPRASDTPIIASRAPRTSPGQRALQRWFDIGVAFKGIEGLVEMVAGAWLAFDPAVLQNVIFRITAKELLHDPDDRIAGALRDFAEHLGSDRHTFAVAYLVAHGLVKVVLAAGLLANKRWAYPFAIVALLALAAYQVYRYTHTHEVLLLVLSAIDVGIVWLVWREAAMRGRTAIARG